MASSDSPPVIPAHQEPPVQINTLQDLLQGLQGAHAEAVYAWIDGVYTRSKLIYIQEGQVEHLAVKLVQKQKEADDLYQQLQDTIADLDKHRIIHGFLQQNNLLRGNASKHDKIEVPKFDGAIDKYPQFKTQLLLKLQNDPRYEEDAAHAVSFIASRLDGKAFHQLHPYVKDGNVKLKSYQEVMRILDSAYLDTERKAKAQIEMNNLRQANRPFAEFVADFRRLQAELDYNESALIDRLKTSISSELRNALVFVDAPNNLEALIQKLSGMDQKLRTNSMIDKQQGRSPFGAPPRRLGSFPATPSTPTLFPSTLATPASPFAIGGDPMDLSATRRRGPLTPAERAQRMASGACLYCGELGHLAKDCPKRPSAHPTRLNQLAIKAASTGVEEPGKE